MSTLTLEAPVSTEMETPVQTLARVPPPSLSRTRSPACKRTRRRRTRFQQVVFASRFAHIARQVRKGTLSPQATLEAVQQLVASVA